MEKVISYILDWLKSSPKWVRVAAPLLLACIASIYLLSSCSVMKSLEVERKQTREIRDTTTVRITQIYRKSTLLRTKSAPDGSSFSTVYCRLAAAMPLGGFCRLGCSLLIIRACDNVVFSHLFFLRQSCF